MAAMVVILKIFKPRLLLNGKSDWTETWWEASERFWGSELVESFY